jgi:hypothetical protein
VPFAFMTDKSDEISIRVQDLIKATSIKLYNPNALMNNRIAVDMPSKEALTEAAELIKMNKIQFVPNK